MVNVIYESSALYTVGWNIILPPGMPNGEDVNQNGTNEQGESSPVKVDTDSDGLRAAERTTRAGGSPALAGARLAL